MFQPYIPAPIGCFNFRFHLSYRFTFTYPYIQLSVRAGSAEAGVDGKGSFLDGGWRIDRLEAGLGVRIDKLF